MREAKPPDELKGSPKFAAFLSSLDNDCELYRRIRTALEAIKANMTVGE